MRNLTWKELISLPDGTRLIYQASPKRKFDVFVFPSHRPDINTIEYSFTQEATQYIPYSQLTFEDEKQFIFLVSSLQETSIESDGHIPKNYKRFQMNSRQIEKILMSKPTKTDEWGRRAASPYAELRRLAAIGLDFIIDPDLDADTDKGFVGIVTYTGGYGPWYIKKSELALLIKRGNQ